MYVKVSKTVTPVYLADKTVRDVKVTMRVEKLTDEQIEAVRGGGHAINLGHATLSARLYELMTRTNAHKDAYLIVWRGLDLTPQSGDRVKSLLLTPLV